MIDGIQPPKRDPSARPKITQSTNDEPSFVPPEMVAAREESPVSVNPGVAPAEVPSWKQANVQKRRRFALPSLSKKQAIIAGVVAALLIGGGVSAFVLTRKKPTPPAPAPAVVEKIVEPPKPTTIASQLTGVQGPLDQNDQPVIGVMVENSPDARPQAGLNQAGVVFEAIAEGGITRFLALYQQDKPDYIGPVRSARLYYIQWLQGFDAGYAHAGGAPEALNYIRGGGVKDIDHGPNGNLFKRVSSRYAPHNLYSDVNKLSEHAKSKGWAKSDFAGFVRKGQETPSATPTARGVNIAISGPKYNVHYDYNPATNSYNRVLAGLPHKDERSGAQLSPKVVIAMAVPYSIQSDGLHSEYKVIGSGKAFVFQDGVVIEAVWEKTDAKSQIKFGDINGSPLAINPGQTWITAIGSASNVTFTP